MNKVREQIKMVAINGRYTHSCLALFYLRNELNRNCPEMSCQLHQFTINDNYYQMLLQLSTGNPEYIFFSAAIWNSALIEKLVADLQRCLPECGLVIGGPQASTLNKLHEVTNVTVVEGAIESVERQFYQDLQAGKLEQNYGRSFFAMQKRNFSYPYRDTDFEDHLKNRHIYYETSRGCPFSCSYCLSAMEKGLFHKDFDTVRNELREILAHRPKVVRFIDRTFNDIPERALQIWQFLKDEGKETLFHFEMAPDRITEQMFEFLETLDFGRFQFEIGIQSTNPATLEAINRRIDPEIAQKSVTRLAQTAKVRLHVDLILGLPHETRESFARSFADVFSMGPHYIQMGLLKILPDTPLCNRAKGYDYTYCKEPPYSILSNRWLGHEPLSELYWFSECVEKFMNNRYFVSLWSYLRTRKEDIFCFFNDLLKICLSGDFFNRPATQELMVQNLVVLAAERADMDLFIEILQYDWLRCGFRFLPDCLLPGSEKEEPKLTRSKLYQSMPPEVAGLYTKQMRNQFFRKSFFLRISRQTVQKLGLETEYRSPCLCVLQEKEYGIHNHNKVIILNS